MDLRAPPACMHARTTQHKPNRHCLCAEPIAAAAAGDAQGHAAFYSELYVALWHESRGDEATAREHVVRAARTQYAQQSGDYMAALARVHCRLRGWALG